MSVQTSMCLMAGMVRDRAVSPVELVESHLAQIAAQNPRLNAFVVVLAEEARAAARLAEIAVMRGASLGLLHGVPVTVKDSFDVAGLPTLSGSRFRLGHKAAGDATAVARLRSAGAIILGKTNTPEFLSSYETDNFTTGRTNNPWNPDRTPGGSSGGEAAAIASFCSAGGIGSDGGGSIRVPAHFCGIAGLKPTPGRISAHGHFPVMGHPAGLLSVAGPLARSVEDLRMLFAVLAGYDSQDPFSAPVPLKPPAETRLRVGVLEQFYDVPVDPEIQRTVRRAAEALSHLAVPTAPFEPYGLERAPNLWWFFFGQLPAAMTKQMIQGREADAHWTSTEFLAGALEQPAPTVDQMLLNLAKRDRMRACLLRQMEETPVLLMPPCGVTAFEHRARHWQIGRQEIGLFQAMMPATSINLLGLPAVVLPFGMSSEGLPIGVQLVGRPYEEELILELAERLETLRGPFAGPPALK
ncbi:MAG TPA: amidase [Bryobacteraceae bacterium]|nr:amidase [Bryobacteraceae bacterium]